MKTLAIAVSASLLALLAPAAHAQYGAPPPPLPPVPMYGADGMPTLDPSAFLPPSPPPLVVEPLSSNDSEDEDGYDVDYEVYYDTAAAENYDDGYDPQAYQQFESALSPYGEWIDDPNYGQVWAPSQSEVGADFSPYATGGDWSMTEYGWTWVSDYGWGWAPFHYGRWVDSSGYGWCWVPGSVWGPAWVGWRGGGGYAGWAPLPPRGVTVGAPRGIRSPWHFVLARDLGSKRPHYLPTAVLPSVFGHTSVVTNLRTASAAGMAVRFNAGPSPSALHVTVPTVPLRSLAPHALPRPMVKPRPGMPLQARPWLNGPGAPMARSGSIPLRPAPLGPHSVTLGVHPQPMPMVYRPSLSQSRPLNGSITVARPGPASSVYFSRPVYAPAAHYDAPANHYSAPASSYSPPASSYSAPAYHYSAPSYSAPTYSAPPSYHYSEPSYSAPSYSAPTASPHFSAPPTSVPVGHSSSGGGGHHR